MQDLEKEKFLNYTHSFPYWVKESKHLIYYCVYVKYLLYKCEIEKKWLEKRFLNKDEEILEYQKVSQDYVDVFHGCTDKIPDFTKKAIDV
jgi:hypothetical protein